MERRIPSLKRMMKDSLREVNPEIKRKLTKPGKLSTRGGARPGAGRPKGSKDGVNVMLDKLINQAIDDAAADGKELTAKVGFQRIYRNKKIPSAVRMRAMKEALPYEDARLASTEVTGAGGGPIEHSIEDIRASIYRKLVKSTRSSSGAGVSSKTE